MDRGARRATVHRVTKSWTRQRMTPHNVCIYPQNVRLSKLRVHRKDSSRSVESRGEGTRRAVVFRRLRDHCFLL